MCWVLYSSYNSFLHLVQVDQAALTGESLPVKKGKGDVAFSGSTIKQGERHAVVYATGACIHIVALHVGCCLELGASNLPGTAQTICIVWWHWEVKALLQSAILRVRQPARKISMGTALRADLLLSSFCRPANLLWPCCCIAGPG